MGFSEPIVHVDMDSFYVACERLRRPDLVGIPVVVGGGGDRGVVAAASYEARQFGVHSAQAMARARRLCPHLIVIPGDHGFYGEVSQSVFALMRSVTPHVEALSVDEAFLDVSGLTKHFPDSPAIAEHIRTRIRDELGLPSSAGVAATKFMAKLGSTVAKPDGLRHIPLDDQLVFLRALDVRALWGVGEATHATLERVGIRTVGELADLDLEATQRLLGPLVGAHLANLARGIDPRSVIPETEAKSISVEETYEDDIHDPAIVRTEVLKHASRLAGRLRRSGVAGRTVTLKLRFSDFETPSRSMTLAAPTDVTRDIHHAALTLLERMPRRGVGVRLLGIGMSQLGEAGAPRQLATDRPPKWDDLEGAVEDVRRRFGERAVEPAALADTPARDHENS